MAENKIIHQCSNCSKSYKSKKTLEKHQDNCKERIGNNRNIRKFRKNNGK